MQQCPPLSAGCPAEPVFLNVYGAPKLIPRNEFRQPMKPEPVFLNVRIAQESIPRNEFRQPIWPGGPVRYLYSYLAPSPIDFLKIPALAGRYDNPIPPRFLAPIDCLKIPALCRRAKASKKLGIWHHMGLLLDRARSGPNTGVD